MYLVEYCYECGTAFHSRVVPACDLQAVLRDLATGGAVCIAATLCGVC